MGRYALINLAEVDEEGWWCLKEVFLSYYVSWWKVSSFGKIKWDSFSLTVATMVYHTVLLKIFTGDSNCLKFGYVLFWVTWIPMCKMFAYRHTYIWSCLYTHIKVASGDTHGRVLDSFFSPGSTVLNLWYFFHPCVIAVARKRSWSFCQKRRWQDVAQHMYTQSMWLWIKWHCKLVHGCMMYTECVPRQQHFHVAPAM